MTLSYIDNHTEMANSRLVQQDKESYNTVNFLNAIIDPVQEIEDSFQDLSYKRSLETALGVNLDNFGLIVGEVRDFRKDEDFRVGILTRIIINMGGGTATDIITAINLLYRPRKIEIKEIYPANFSLFIRKEYDNLLGIRGLINSIKPVGIGKVDIFTVKGEDIFKFSESSSESVNYLVNSTLEQNLDLNETATVSPLLVEADTISSSAGSFGFGEFILASSKVIGGGTLAEVINYD